MASEACKEKTSSVLPQVTSSSGLPMSSPRQQSKSLLVAQATLRISAVVFTLIAISVIVTNTQSVIVFGFKFEAHYTYSTAFKFLVGANAVVCAFSALSLIFLSLFLSRSVPQQQQQQLKNYFFLLLHDVVMMVLIISGCAAATAIGYVGRYGEKKMTWQPTCGYVSKYCNRMSISLAFSYLAFFAYLLLTFTSALTLMSRPTTRGGRTLGQEGSYDPLECLKFGCGLHGRPLGQLRSDPLCAHQVLDESTSLFLSL